MWLFHGQNSKVHENHIENYKWRRENAKKKKTLKLVIVGNILSTQQSQLCINSRREAKCFALSQSTRLLLAPSGQTTLQVQAQKVLKQSPTPRAREGEALDQNLAGEKCGSCMCLMRKRRNWVGNKPRVHALIAKARLRPWMLRSSGDFASCPCASRSRGSIFVLHVLDV